MKPPLQRTHRGMQNGHQNMAVHIDHPDPSKVYFNVPATDRDKSKPPNTAPATKSDNSTLLHSTCSKPSCEPPNGPPLHQRFVAYVSEVDLTSHVSIMGDEFGAQ